MTNHSDSADHVPHVTGETGSVPPVVQLIKLPGRSSASTSPVGEKSAGYEEIVRESLANYANQVGGHRVLVQPKDSSMVWKPFDEAEYQFYDECVRAACSSLLPFTARCFGEVSVSKSSKYVMLEDLAHGLSNPCILDLKMGVKQRSVRNFSSAKVASKEAKSIESTSHSLGFRIGGAQMYSSDGSLSFYNKYFGRTQNVQETYILLSSFFHHNTQEYITQLETLSDLINNLSGFRFWSGSLLFIRDETHWVLKMIDFANYTYIASSNEPDREYLFGIASIIKFLHAIELGQETPPIGSPPDPQLQDIELRDAVDHINNIS